MKTKSEVSSTVLRATKVLRYLKNQPGPQSITNISKDLELSPTIVHRLLTTLKLEGFVFQDAQSKLYSLGSVFLEYANKIVTELPFSTIIEPKLIYLRNITGETVGFYIPSGLKRICAIEYESNQEIRRSVGIGTQHPIHVGATGRAILAFQTEQFINNVFNSIPSNQRTSLKEKLDQTKNSGYAISFEEINKNVAAVSAPVFDQNDRVVGAVSISGPMFRFNQEKIDEIVNHLLVVTKDIKKSFL